MVKKVKQQTGLLEEIIPKRSLVEEVENSFMEYAMSVIVSRALPDVRDGLKPVHRRIFWAMHESNFTPDRNYVKCARVIGEVMGKYHPHGDQSIYDALARMGQHFSLRQVLIDGHGNFGSPSDPPAAMRYTECRLAPLATYLLKDIDEDTVDFSPNFDGGDLEPNVLPAKFPNLLLNGTTGIAVGMATNIPSHNLFEIHEATKVFLKSKSEFSDDEIAENADKILKKLLLKIQGPDFSTGGTIFLSNKEELYRTGRGSFKVRAKYEFEKRNIVVTEIPQFTSIDSIAEKAAELVNSGKIIGLKDIRNESGQGQIRLVFECRPESDKEIILNNLFKYTPMQSSFSVNMLALVSGVPKTLSLVEYLNHWVNHQLEVIVRRSEFRLQKALDRFHIVEGLITAVEMLDEVIKAIRESDNRAIAKQKLLEMPFNFTNVQAQHILDLTLGRLTKLGIQELLEELEKLRQIIKELRSILKDKDSQLEIVSKELSEVVASQKLLDSTKRQSVIVGEEAESISTEDLVVVRDCTLNFTARFFVRNNFKKTDYKDPSGDVISKKVNAKSDNYVVVFSSLGKAYKIRVNDILDNRFVSLISFFEFDVNEKIVSFEVFSEVDNINYIVFTTNSGQIKKLPKKLIDSAAHRKDGFLVVKVDGSNEVVSVEKNSTEQDCVIVTKKAKTLRFSLREMGRSASGVRGIKLEPDDEVIGSFCVKEDENIYAVTTSGYSIQRTIQSFSTQARAGKGVRFLSLKPASSLINFCGRVDSSLVYYINNTEVLSFNPSEFPVRKEPTIGSKQLSLVSN